MKMTKWSTQYNLFLKNIINKTIAVGNIFDITAALCSV